MLISIKAEERKTDFIVIVKFVAEKQPPVEKENIKKGLLNIVEESA